VVEQVQVTYLLVIREEEMVDLVVVLELEEVLVV
jgi:hypothetical protein